MIRLDLIRRAFDTAMLAKMRELMPENPSPFVWLPINSDANPEAGKLQILTSLQPGQAYSEELGGADALSRRVGVYIITQSLPKKMSVDTSWKIGGELEMIFRRNKLQTEQCPVQCQEPYTESRGTDPEQGRFLISTTVPWYVILPGI